MIFPGNYTRFKVTTVIIFDPFDLKEVYFLD